MAAWSHGGATQHGALSLEAPWTRAAGQGGQGAGFLTIRNAGGADRLLSASTPAAGRTELHTMLRDGDIMRMRQVEAIAVPANGAVSLAPGGLHIMLIARRAGGWCPHADALSGPGDAGWRRPLGCA
ncbi:MAG: copper chaperone PCu(A)C [Rhodospirillales bacterium]|nr:copper chaperone PCu(A)C [Rhodospirillales bacterium]